MLKFGLPDPGDLFDDELNCICCAALTGWEAPRCPVCGQSLWTKRRDVETRSPAYWTLILLEMVFILLSALLALLLLTYVGMRVRLDSVLQLLPVYLGRVKAPPAEAAILFGLVPRNLFWLALLPGGLSVCVVLGLLSRWPPLYFVMVFLEGLRIIAGLGMLVIVIGSRLETLPSAMMRAYAVKPAGQWVDWLRAGVIGSDVVIVALSVLSLMLLFRLYDHFSFQKRRLVLRLDDVVGNEVSLWLHGRAYARQKLWALAALHLHHALLLKETLEAYLVLAVAYMNLARFELAEKVLNSARRMDPGNPRINELLALLADKRRD